MGQYERTLDSQSEWMVVYAPNVGVIWTLSLSNSPTQQTSGQFTAREGGVKLT